MQQDSRDSQALQLIPEREQRDEGGVWVKRLVWALRAQVVNAARNLEKKNLQHLVYLLITSYFNNPRTKTAHFPGQVKPSRLGVKRDPKKNVRGSEVFYGKCSPPFHVILHP